MAYAQHLPQVPRRSPLLGFIVLMHAVAIYYINDGLRIHIPIPLPDMRWVNIAPELKPIKPLEPLKLKDPALKPTVVVAPEPRPVDVPADSEPVVKQEPEPQPIVDAGDSSVVASTMATMDRRHPIGKPEYPARAVREGTEGLVVVTACVQPTGLLTGLRVARSSGSDVLDTAAVKHLARPGTRLLPATVDGQPVLQCVDVPIRFDLENR